MARLSRIGRWVVFSLAVWSLPSLGAGDVRESWDAIYVSGQRVGYFHTSVTPLEEKGKPYFRVQVDMSLTFRRGRDLVTIDTLYGTIETPEGQVLRLDSRTAASQTEMRIHGDVSNGKMKLTLEGSGEKQVQTIDWGDDVRGPYGAEMSMARTPMKTGETREVKTFIPDLNRVGLAKLVAKEVSTVTLGGGVKRELMKVDQVTFADGKPIPGMAQTHWVDSTGQILKSYVDALGGMETYRTTKEAATRSVAQNKFDLNSASILKVEQKITQPYERKEVVYSIKMKDEDAAAVLPNDRRQTVAPSSDPKVATLTIKSAGPTVGEAGPETVDEQYLRPNALITCKDPGVIRLSRTAAGNAVDPWEKAKAIQHWVFTNVKKKNFETAFAAANEVARNMEGDCTEHSVLTATLCRAQGIPTRVVVGLLYDEPHSGFGFHMWNEVYVNRRWVAIDSAWDQTDVDAVHVKLAEASLEGIAPYETFLSVVRVFNKMTIEPVEIR
jgi:hypothetical protein